MDIDSKRFGILLKNALKNSHETQPQLAEIINVSQSTISKIVNGKYTLSPELAISIAKHFPDNAQLNAMVGPYSSRKPENPTERELCSYIPYLKHDDQEFMLRLAKTIVASYQTVETD